ncbi:MAG: creatininase family protein [Gemmatimonadetes bacterium]|nr:creatininase family protein [Gemmatimonadota bacterium]
MTDLGPWRWQDRTASEVESLSRRDPVCVLPLAAIEQHGPHLPLSTDLEIGVGILREALDHLDADVPLAVLPVQSVGASREHGRFPGTLSLDDHLLVQVLVETGRALAAIGIRRLVVLNSHGGNRHALDGAGLRLREEHGMLVVKANYFRFPRPEGIDLDDNEWRHGLHGGAVETAMMLHLRPDLVRHERIKAAPSISHELEKGLDVVGPEGVAPFAWLAGDLHASGVVGDPRLATAEMGQALVKHYARVLVKVLMDARRFPLERLL